MVGPRERGRACRARPATAAAATEPTVTDADLVAGRIPPDAAFPGLGALDVAAARAALARAGVDAEGVIAVVDAAMEQALRAVSVERGVDPRGLALVAFGGAGPLHACALADALGMPAVIVPARAGVLSAVGLLGAPRQRRPRARRGPTPRRPRRARRARCESPRWPTAGRDARSAPDAPTSTSSLDCRYAGQSHELTVPTVDEFHDEHERRNGYARPDAPVEVVALRASRARSPSPVDLGALPPAGATAARPARRSIAEPDCTIWVPDGLAGRRRGAAGALVLTRGACVTPRPGGAAGADRRGSTGVAEEMGAVLRRAAFSPNIKERADCSAALFTADGELLVQAEHIPVHLGSMPASVRGRDRRRSAIGARPGRAGRSSTTRSPAAPT